jgi:hypothetical protein
METKYSALKGPAGTHAMLVRYLGTTLARSICLRLDPCVTHRNSNAVDAAHGSGSSLPSHGSLRTLHGDRSVRSQYWRNKTQPFQDGHETGPVSGERHPRHRAKELIKFLKRYDRAARPSSSRPTQKRVRHRAFANVAELKQAHRGLS